MNKLLKFNSPRTLRWSMLLLGAFSLTTTIKAQKIDFDMTGRRSEEVTMNGFTSWQVGQLGYGASATTTVGRACVTVKNSTGGYQLRTSWYKAGINSDKLINDGIHHDGSPQRSTSITVQVSGLSNGTHSLQAYHNNCDGLNGASITVSVNGRKVTTVNPSNRAASTAKAAKSYVTSPAHQQPLSIAATLTSSSTRWNLMSQMPMPWPHRPIHQTMTSTPMQTEGVYL